MAAPDGKFYPVGLKFVQVIPLSSFGYPAGGSVVDAPSIGYEVAGPKAFDITPAKPRDVVHVGNDRRLSQDKLPAIDASAATLKTSRMDFDVLAALTNTKVHTQGEALTVGLYTNEQGSEPAVGLVMYQQGKSTGGARVYGSYHILSAICMLDLSSMNENPSEYTWNVAQSSVDHPLFGVDFTEADDGFTSAEILWSEHVNRPIICSWLANASSTELLFPAAHQAASVDKIHTVIKITSAGVVTDVTSSITKATDGITVTTTSPAVGDVYVAFYEY